MAHDKENIDKIKKAKGFDSEMDPVVLGIDEKERKNLSKSFSKAKDENEENKEKFNPLAGFGESYNKNQESDESIFQKIINFFKSLFKNLGFSSGANISSKEIKKIKHNLSGLDIVLVNFKTKKLDAAFARHIFSIYKVLKQVRVLFEEAGAENSEISLGEPIFFVRFISNLLSDKSKEKLKIFTNEYINNLIETETNPLVVLKTQLQDFENEISIHERSKINSFVEPIERVLTCDSYNFEKFLRLFIPYNPELYKKENKLDPELTAETDAPELSAEKFGDVDVDKALVELKKLNDYLRVLDSTIIPDEFNDNFDDILSSLKSDVDVPGDSPVHNEKITEPKVELGKPQNNDNRYDEIDISAKDIVEVFEKAEKFNSKNIIDGIIRYFTEDTSYKGKMVRVKVFLINKYIELLKEKALGNFNRLEVFKREQKVTKNITSFFGVKSLKNLSTIKNYDEDMNKELTKRHVENFVNTRKGVLLKNFINRIYKVDIESAIKNLLVTGDFIDKEGQQDFSESFYKIEQRQKDFADFEIELSDQSEEMQKIKTFLHSAMHDISIKNVARRKVREIDAMCEQLFNDFVIELTIILKYLDKCITDSKSSRPTFVYNMRNISGANNKTFVNNIYKAYDEIKEFLNISKNFTLIHNKL